MTLSDLELFGHTLALSPAVLRRPCVVCGLTYIRPQNATHHLCELCASDFPKAAAVTAEGRVTAQRLIDEHLKAWTARLDEMDDALWERFSAMHEAHGAAIRVLNDARTARYPSGAGGREQAVQDARARLERVEEKIERTYAKGGELAAWIGEWREYRRKLRHLQDERQRWTAAEQEVEAAREGLPF